MQKSDINIILNVNLLPTSFFNRYLHSKTDCIFEGITYLVSRVNATI